MMNLLKRNWRVLLSSTFIAAFAASIFVFLMTPQYESSTTLLAGNSQLTDKARLFNPQIKDLTQASDRVMISTEFCRSQKWILH